MPFFLRTRLLLLPRQFEELICEILAGFGWEVQLTPATRDGGYDMFAISQDLVAGVQTSWIIECKKYSAEKKVLPGDQPIATPRGR